MGVVVKWLAHSGFEIKADEKIIYVDLEEHGEPSEKADLILVTHSHADHCDPNKVKKVRKEGTVIIAPEDCVSKIGGNVKTLKAGEEMSFGNIRIKAVDAYNTKRFRSPGNPYHPKGLGVGYLIMAEGKTIYHAGDTDLIPEMRKLGKVDVALLPSGGTYTMDDIEAADAAVVIKPKIVLSMHRWNTNPEEFRRMVEAKSEIKVLMLKEGEEFQVV
jgi:L-ascorbate metabolism protein UlaG (beta-lactamase superfamily)